MPRKPAKDFALVETQDSTIAKMVIGATQQAAQAQLDTMAAAL
ncbi:MULTISPECIES: hypothetical protein [Acidithiobacillus]|jgi:hypothetical protein|nr:MULTISPECIES: hypothetical protein [Acidithiobacillus]MDD5278019.1 hypothetical protein [Acidithiobacillus sp.]